MGFRSKYATKEVKKHREKYRVRIENQARKDIKESNPVRGPRAVFLEKYKLTGNLEAAKLGLDENGYKSSIYKDEDLQKWIDEERI